MYLKYVFLVILVTQVSNVVLFTNVYKKIPTISFTGDPGTPLFLTPLIEAGKIKEAQNASKVTFKGMKNIVSYSGYFTVDKKYNSNIFFWFFPSMTNTLKAPVVLWMNGGPGATSLIGLFTENGPFSVKHKHGLKTRKYAWTKTNSVLYIDNPVGTGYSFTNDESGYAKSETDVGNNLYEALVQFFELFPEYQKNDFFVTGESYAGKYVPAVSYAIDQKNPTAKLKINLKGLAMGNGLSDPLNQLKYGDYLYQLGLIDLNCLSTFHEKEAEGKKYIQNKQWDKAFEVFDALIDGDMTTGPSVFTNCSAFHFYFNYMYDEDPSKFDDFGKYVQRADVRAAIHVGNISFGIEANKVEQYLKQDIMQSVTPWISELLTKYRVLVYNGQFDIIVAYPLTLNYLQNLNFNAAAEYKTAKRYPWYVGKQLAGYSKTAGNLTEILVRNAGHMVPTDQPEWAFDLINRFTVNKPFHL